MSDPHGHGGGGGEGKKINPIYLGVGAVFFIVFVVYFYFNPSSVDTLTIILHVIQGVCVLIMLFLFFKLEKFRKAFADNGAAIVHNYESKLKHHHDHVELKADLKSKYGLAVEHIHSKSENEWKTGLIELDNFIRMALVDAHYEGETTIDLINDAKSKGHKHIGVAEDIAYLRQRLKSKGLQFDFTRKDLEILLDKFQAFKKTVLPDEESSHGHDDTHAKH